MRKLLNGSGMKGRGLGLRRSNLLSLQLIKVCLRNDGESVAPDSPAKKGVVRSEEISD